MKVSKPPFDYELFQAHLRVLLPCGHPQAEPRKKIKAGNGQPYYRIQCPDCGAPLSPHLSFDVVEDFRTTFGPIRPWDAAREEAWLEKRLRFGRWIADHINAERHAWWWREYDAYLRTPEWAAKREIVLTRCKRVCEACGSARATDVHHLNYKRVGEELDTDLLGLCRECHDTIHMELPEGWPSRDPESVSHSKQCGDCAP